MKPYGVRKTWALCWGIVDGKINKLLYKRMCRKRARSEAKRTFRIIGRDIEVDTRYY